MNRPVTQTIAAGLLGIPEAAYARAIEGGPVAPGDVCDLQATSIRDLLGLARTEREVIEAIGRTLELRGVRPKTRASWTHAADVRLGEIRAKALSR